MFTVFDLLQFVVPLFGLMFGAIVGGKHYGIIGALIGALLGAVIGFFAGRLPFLIVWKLVGFEGKSTARLWRFIREDDYFVFHIVFPLLMSRGEDVTSEKGRILELLLADNWERRRFGWASLQIVFPEISQQIADFNPESPVPAHLELLRKLTRIRSPKNSHKNFPDTLARLSTFPYNFFLPLSKGLFFERSAEKIPKRIWKSAEPESSRDICKKPDKLR